MTKILEELYQQFYVPSPQLASKQEIKEYHRQLINRLAKPE